MVHLFLIWSKLLRDLLWYQTFITPIIIKRYAFFACCRERAYIAQGQNQRGVFAEASVSASCLSGVLTHLRGPNFKVAKARYREVQAGQHISE